jgi:hypothetical protein
MAADDEMHANNPFLEVSPEFGCIEYDSKQKESV